MDLYVYYRVQAEQAALLQARVSAMQRRLTDEHGILASLKYRPDVRDGHQTWMEVYLDVPADFNRLLARTVAAMELGPLIDGERHTESFLDFLPCA